MDGYAVRATDIENVPVTLRMVGAVAAGGHFEGVVQGELDLRLESSAASEFTANTSNDAGFGLPPIIWNLSARRVMTLGWADGVPLGDNAGLDAAGHDRHDLGERVLRLFLLHALRRMPATTSQSGLVLRRRGHLVLVE